MDPSSQTLTKTIYRTQTGVLLLLLSLLLLLIYTPKAISENSDNNISLGSFTKTSTEGQSWVVRKTISYSIFSCVRCASDCVRHRVVAAAKAAEDETETESSSSDSGCIAFECQQQGAGDGGTCNFYNTGSTPLPSPGLQVYAFEVEAPDVPDVPDVPTLLSVDDNGFHRVAAGGFLYDIFMSDENYLVYEEADKYCQDTFGGYLLHLDSSTVYKALEVVARDVSEQWYYVGASDVVTEGDWKMEKDGESIPESWNWATDNGEPNDNSEFDKQEDCATVNSKQLDLFDSTCVDAHLFICQKDVVM